MKTVTRHQWASHIVGWRTSMYTGQRISRGPKKTARFVYRCQRCHHQLPEGTTPPPWWASPFDTLTNCKERHGDEGQEEEQQRR